MFTTDAREVRMNALQRNSAVHCAGVVLCLTLGTSAMGVGKALPVAPASGPMASERRTVEDAHYGRIVKAYRGELSHDEVVRLTEEDPTPAIHLGPSRELRNLVRVFASLPDSSHEELRRKGLLKWRLEDLPRQQRRWIADLLKRFESEGDGPFRSGVHTGFMRVVVVDAEGEETTVYSWWVTGEKAIRPLWIPLVRANGLGGGAFTMAHAVRVQELRTAETDKPVPDRLWLKIPEPARLDTTAVAVEEAQTALEQEFWMLVHAYQGRLKREQLAKLIAADPVIERRLRKPDALDRAINQFFSRLDKKEHAALIDTGRIEWPVRDLTPAQRRLLLPVIDELNRLAVEAGNIPPYSLAGPFGCMVGFALVQVPGIEKPVLSWWARSPIAPVPAWFSLHNGAAVKAPGYYRAHLEQLAK